MYTYPHPRLLKTYVHGMVEAEEEPGISNYMATDCMVKNKVVGKLTSAKTSEKSASARMKSHLYLIYIHHFIHNEQCQDLREVLLHATPVQQ